MPQLFDLSALYMTKEDRERLAKVEEKSELPSPTIFIGTQAEWDSLSRQKQLQYQSVHLFQMSHCPRCNAPLDYDRNDCEYCGTPYAAPVPVHPYLGRKNYEAS